MSNPHHSLSKISKPPFRRKNEFDKSQSNEIKNIPQLNPLELDSSDADLNDLLDEVTTTMAKNKLKDNCASSRSSRSSQCAPLTEDFDLMNRLLSRIKQLELAKRFHEKEIKDQKMQISILEDKVKLYKSTKDINESNTNRCKVLEKENKNLKIQIGEIEQFLADYGLKWVGENGDNNNEQIPTIISDSDYPMASLDTVNFKVNYDRILTNVKELNRAINSDEIQISLTEESRAELKNKQSMVLVLYANGIQMGIGNISPIFRDFCEESTRLVIQDLTDGYYPTELEDKYPFGIVIDITDRRSIYYEVKPKPAVFQGQGRILGNSNNAASLGSISKLLLQDTSSSVSSNQIESNSYTQPFTSRTQATVVPPMTVEQFLCRLPSSKVSSSGKLINIRSSIETALDSGRDMAFNAPKKETSSTTRIDEDINDTNTPCTTIKIRSSKANDQTQQLKLPYSTTVACLYSKVSALFKLPLSTFTLQTPPYSKVSKLDPNSQNSLESVGLIPNAVLVLQEKKL